MTPYAGPKKRPPLDEDMLRELALRYVGRFATTQARLSAYLDRKVKDRGWGGENPPDIPALVSRMQELNYVDDEAYALMKSAAMRRRGLGGRRIRSGLRADGVGEQDRTAAEDVTAVERWDAAHNFARRKRIGPFAVQPADPAQRKKHIASFLRAGHDFATAQVWVGCLPGELPERDE